MEQTFGDRILEKIRENWTTQRELARQIGVAESTMCRYIRHERTPNGRIIAKMAAALHTTSDYLLGKEDSSDPEGSYDKVYRAVIRHAKNWTAQQKTELVNLLFQEGN